MCDIWKANKEKKEISVGLLKRHIDSFRKLGVREVVLSGGEALMHSNLWQLCELLRRANIRVTLLSTGLLLKNNAGEIIRYLSEVIVSLDGSKEVHNRIRNVPLAYEKLAEGVATIKSMNPSFRVTARCVLQKQNYFDLPSIIRSACDLGLDQVSFLGADVSTPAFNRLAPGAPGLVNDVAITSNSLKEFSDIVEKTFVDFANDYQSGFIAEKPWKMRRIVQYYYAMAGHGEFPAINCNAPWVSAVIESDGRVMPCFFHEAYGSILEDDLLNVINSSAAIRFRKNLSVNKNETCKKCVCSLKLGVREMN
jgi:MoaA/NifB/PqqE/SkfB family radical SAM enzyme